MGRFIVIPEIKWVGGRYPWQLVTPLMFDSEILGKRLLIPAGYRTDLASVPRLPFVHMWTAGRANMPAIVHDYLYDCWTDRITRKQADQVFLEAMRAMAEPHRAITRQAMYAGVRLGGWRGWKTDSHSKCRRT